MCIRDRAIGVPQFHSQESRKYQRSVLMEAGEIHRQQEVLQEQVGKLFPHLHDPKVKYTDARKSSAKESLPAIAEKQKSVNELLGALITKLDGIGEQLNDDERTAAIQAAAQAAKQQSVTAAESLEGDDPYATLAAQDAAVAKVSELLGTLKNHHIACLLYTSPSPRDRTRSRMPSSA